MAGKKHGPDPGLQQLKQDLARDTIGTLYVFYGEEVFLRDAYLEQLKTKLLPAGAEAFNLHVFQGKDLETWALSDAVNAFPMMAQRTMVLVYDYDLYKNESRRDALMTLLEDLPDYVCLIFLYDLMEYKAGGNTKLGKLVKKKATIVQFHPQNQSDLNAWIRRRFHTFHKEIDNATAEYLTFLCGGLMTGLASEIDKIGAYAPGDHITKADMDAVVDPVLDARVFQMTDAISERNFSRASEILSDLYRMNTEPIVILAVLGRHLRQLWSARLVLERRMGQGELAALWEMKSPWQARKLMDAARRFDLPWCRRAVKRCAETDLSMKSSGLDNQALLTALLLQLANG